METFTEIAATAAFHIAPLAILLLAQIRAERRAVTVLRLPAGRT